MLNRITQFSRHEDGAVTIDWVVLTAALVGMGGLLAVHFAQPVRTIDSNVGQALTSAATQTAAQVITVNFTTP